jgi:shikimate kinase
MGSGKSTVGRKLAARLELNFLDLDIELEKRFNISISAWFEQKGESDFREQEALLIKELSQQSGLLISTGGGTPCFKENLDVMGKSGVVVYLELPLPILFSRVKKEAGKRPLLAGKSDEEMLSFITVHFEERRAYYEQAHLKIQAQNIDSNSIKDVADLLKALL